ncbi:MAG: PqqD family peptide modification chaperone [Parasporobacterium sp.]|nr:PqqD family peptide modification chaperone [Parasporobacterium sp.]
MEYTEIYYLDKAFEVENKEDQYLLVDYENANWFRTNETGMMILEKCDGTKPLDDVVGEIASAMGFSKEMLESYMNEFINRAIERKVLLKKDEEHVCIGTEFPDYPNQLWVHVSNRCNMNCPFCYSSSNAEDKYNLVADEVLRFVAQIPENQRKEIVISGGEPFLYKEIVALTKGLKEMGFDTTLITNGTVGHDLYPEVIPNLGTLQISCDGTTPYYYEHTRGKGNFAKFVANLDWAKECGMKNLAISFTPNTFNLENIGEIPQFAYDHGINHLHITKLTPAGRAQENMDSLAPSFDATDNGLKILAEKLIEINNRIKTENELSEIMMTEKKPFITLSFARNISRKVIYQTKITTCSLATGTLSIGYDGFIYPCGNFSSEEYRLGSLKDRIDDVMKKGKEFAFEHGVESPKMKDCYSCKYKYFCGSGCRVCALFDGDIYAADAYCERTKKQIYELMWKTEEMSAF